MAKTETKIKTPKSDRKQNILRAAWELFREKEFDNVSMSEIAERAGTATGTVYLFAGDKTDLLHKVLTLFVTELVENIEKELSFIDGDLIRVRFVVQKHLATLISEPELCTNFIREIHAGGHNPSPEIIAIKRLYSGTLTMVLEEAMQNGFIRSDISLNMIRSILFGGLEQLSLRTWVGQDTIDQKARVDDLMRILTAWVSARES